MLTDYPAHTVNASITLALGLCLALACAACQSTKATKAQVWRESDPAYVPFAVTEMVISENNRFTGLTVDERTQKSEALSSKELTVYILDLTTGEHRLLGDGSSALIPTASEEHDFLYDSSSKSPVVLIKGLQSVRSFAIDRGNGVWWNRKSRMAIFDTAWPQDREGFSAIALLNTETGDIVSVKLNASSERLAMCNATGHFFSESIDTNNESSAEEFDASGAFIGRLNSSLAVYSANCRYVLPFSALPAHGPDDWAIFEAASRLKLMDFPWSDDPAVDSQWFSEWNPHYDNLLLTGSEKAGAAVIDIAQQKILRRIPDNGAPVIFSGDGRATVTVRDQHIVFDPLPADSLN